VLDISTAVAEVGGLQEVGVNLYLGKLDGFLFFGFDGEHASGGGVNVTPVLKGGYRIV